MRSSKLMSSYYDCLPQLLTDTTKHTSHFTKTFNFFFLGGVRYF